MRGCLELDLKNCQLDIVAAIFKVESVKAFLRTGKSFWTEMLEWLGLPKKAIKKALYNLIYGMHPSHVMCFLREDLCEQSIYYMDNTFLDHPLVIDVANAIKQAKIDIVAKGGMMSEYGWAKLEGHDIKSHEIDSFLSCCIQTYELKMIAGATKYSRQSRSRAIRGLTFCSISMTALAIAAAVPTIPISPIPFAPIGFTYGSSSSIHDTSIVPTSAFVAMWYSAKSWFS